MIKALSRFEEKIKRKIPQRTILLLPGEYFFTRMIELPEAIESTDIEQFAELSLEGISPFPLEHLFWGFHYDDGSPHILVYAAHRERLRKNGYEDLENHEHVFPDFLANRQKGPERPGITFFYHGATLNALYHNPGSGVPVKVHSKVLPEPELKDEDLLQHREALLKSLDRSNFEASDEVQAATIAEGKAGGKPQLFYRKVNEAETGWQRNDALHDLPESTRWQADVRDKGFLRKERKALATSGKVWLAAVGAGIAAVLLLLLQLGIVTGNVWNKSRQNKIEEQSEEFAYVEERQNLSEKIDQYVQQELKPFEMLSLLNVGRPKIIHFTEASANSFNQLTVEGEGNNVEAVNNYTQSLRNSQGISSVESKVRSTQGKARFTLQITFDEQPAETEPSQVVAEVESGP